MIDTLFFVLQIFGVVVVIGWALMNDRIRNDEPSRGPLAFKSGAIARGKKMIGCHDRSKFSSLRKDSAVR